MYMYTTRKYIYIYIHAHTPYIHHIEPVAPSKGHVFPHLLQSLMGAFTWRSGKHLPKTAMGCPIAVQLISWKIQKYHG